MNERIGRAGAVAVMAALFGSLTMLFVALSVSGQTDAAPPFSLDADPPSTTVYQGQHATYTVTLHAVQGFTLPVTLSAVPDPQLTGSLAPTTLRPGETATLVLTSSLATDAGMHGATVTGTATVMSGTIALTYNATTHVSLGVRPADFALQVTPTLVSAFQGERAVFTITLTGTTPGFAWPVALELAGVPPGTSLAISPPEIAPGGQATLLLTTSQTALLGVYPLIVRGTAGDLMRSAGTTLRVRMGVYLPLVAQDWPVFPNQPVLLPISNPDHDGTYYVYWTEPPEQHAHIYVLQEATDRAFTTGVRDACTTNLWACTVQYQPLGTYYYRVRGWNPAGFGPWSAVEAVTVLFTTP